SSYAQHSNALSLSRLAAPASPQEKWERPTRREEQAVYKSFGKEKSEEENNSREVLKLALNIR
ncbi:MAG: hypothetical protein ACLFTH_04330, partial [Candidatus Woesearchaeota archaeon]